MKENSIVVKHLKKQYGEIKAVDDISFEVRKGEMFSFLGLNGAGKSTTINILTGTLDKDEGEVFLFDQPVEQTNDQLHKEMGVVFQFSALDRFLTVQENLLSRGMLYGMKKQEVIERIAFLSEQFDFASFLKRPLGKLSGGQKRKIDVARALIHQPKILILDEPTTGLDPQTRKLLWNVLHAIRKKEGLTIFLTTHYMEEASNSDFIVMIDHGKIVAADTPDRLKERYAKDTIKLYRENMDEKAVQQMIEKERLVCQEERDFYLIAITSSLQAKALILQYPDVFVNFEITKGTMDDVFLTVTGKTIKETV